MQAMRNKLESKAAKAKHLWTTLSQNTETFKTVQLYQTYEHRTLWNATVIPQKSRRSWIYDWIYLYILCFALCGDKLPKLRITSASKLFNFLGKMPDMISWEV